MDTPTDTAMLLIPAGIVIGTFLLAHAYVTRHLPADAVPAFLESRIAWTARVRPLLLACAGLALLSGVVLQVS